MPKHSPTPQPVKDIIRLGTEFQELRAMEQETWWNVRAFFAIPFFLAVVIGALAVVSWAYREIVIPVACGIAGIGALIALFYAGRRSRKRHLEYEAALRAEHQGSQPRR
jgi:uncharacterized membrane protein YoaK (UPF0700 family)